MNPTAVVAVVDDEPAVRRALGRLLRAEGFDVRSYASAGEFLDRVRSEPVDCAVVDVAMPGLTGLELQARLKREGVGVPLIFLTGRGDIPMSVRAIKEGAVNFLTKPVDASALLAAVQAALEDLGRRRVAEEERGELRRRFDLLTPREFEVLRHVIAGKPNKRIAADLGVGEQTVKVHRMRITEKLGLTSVAEIVRGAERLGVQPAA